jgi:NDP-sugar pyrophosphorylase family protein
MIGCYCHSWLESLYRFLCTLYYLELRGKPVLEYNIERALEIENIDEIVIVVGYRAEDIINRYGINYKGKRIKYVIQWEQKGVVHAIECAKEAIGKDDFFLVIRRRSTGK